MERLFKENLYFGNDVFIPVESAFEYLECKEVVFLIDKLFLYYKGFAYQDDDAADLIDSNSWRVYLNAVSLIEGIEPHAVWRMLDDDVQIFTEDFKFYQGKINGKEMSVNDLCNSNNYYLDFGLSINYSNLYVRQTDLDFFSEEYGIPKNTCWNDSSSKSIAIENKNNFDVDNSEIYPSDSPQDLLINFTKSVLSKNPNAKTADIRRNCFEEMQGLNPRDSKIINDLLIKAGAIKSKQGEHAKHIV